MAEPEMSNHEESWKSTYPCHCGGKLHEITVNTHKPNKWRLVDIETGEVWKFNVASGGLLRATDIVFYRKKGTDAI